MANQYLAGTLVRAATYSGSIGSPVGGFRDDTGALADPDEVIFSYQPGANSVVISYTYPDSHIVKDGVGLYHADLDTTSVSQVPLSEWKFQWYGTGTIQATASGLFEVVPGLGI